MADGKHEKGMPTPSMECLDSGPGNFCGRHGRFAAAIGPRTQSGPSHHPARSFVSPQKVQYRYRLAGFENEWTEAGSRRTVWYTDLSPGRYTFQVQAANSSGVWNREGDSFSFRLMPPLERTPLAYAGYVLLVLHLVWSVIALRTRHLTQRQRELIRIINERTAQHAPGPSSQKARRSHSPAALGLAPGGWTSIRPTYVR